MWPDRVSNPGPLAYESGALPTALRGPAQQGVVKYSVNLLQLGRAQLLRFCTATPFIQHLKFHSQIGI